MLFSLENLIDEIDVSQTSQRTQEDFKNKF